MANCTCEDISVCKNFQAAICLHCNHRLCIQHIIEHDKIVFSDIEKLSNLTDVAFQQIKDKSEKSKNSYNDLLSICNEWQKEQLEKIEQIYKKQSNLIMLRQEALKIFHRELVEQLERSARQPLERIQRQQNTNIEIFSHIQYIIDNIREECVNLKWDFLTSPAINIEYSPPDLPSISTKDDTKLIESQSTSNEKPSSMYSSPLPTNDVVKLRKGRGLKRLVKMFSNVSSIKQSKIEIDAYIKNQKHFKLPILISSYLTACHQKSKKSEQTFLLIEHISTIQKYLSRRTNEFDVLIGIQAFIFNKIIPNNNSEIMTLLLQFFLHHQCINEKLLFDWYYNNDAHGYMGFEEAKQLAEPFIKSLNK